jgi:hypothetical protein
MLGASSHTFAGTSGDFMSCFASMALTQNYLSHEELKLAY